MPTTTAACHLLFALILAAASSARAEDPTPSKTTSAAGAGGGAILSLGLGGGPGGIMGVASAQARRGSRLLGFRIAESSEFNLFGPSPALADTEYGLLFGRYSARKAGFVSASAGLSVVRSVRRGRSLGSNCDSMAFMGCLFSSTRYEKVVSHTFGVPFEARAVLATRFAGLGVGVFGNLNGNGSFVGVGLTLDVGLLR